MSGMFAPAANTERLDVLHRSRVQVLCAPQILKRARTGVEIHSALHIADGLTPWIPLSGRAGEVEACVTLSGHRSRVLAHANPIEPQLDPQWARHALEALTTTAHAYFLSCDPHYHVVEVGPQVYHTYCDGERVYVFVNRFARRHRCHAVASEFFAQGNLILDRGCAVRELDGMYVAETGSLVAFELGAGAIPPTPPCEPSAVWPAPQRLMLLSDRGSRRYELASLASGGDSIEQLFIDSSSVADFLMERIPAASDGFALRVSDPGLRATLHFSCIPGFGMFESGYFQGGNYEVLD